MPFHKKTIWFVLFLALSVPGSTVHAQLNTSGGLNVSGGLNSSGSLNTSGALGGGTCAQPGYYYLSNGDKVYYNGDGTYYNIDKKVNGGIRNPLCVKNNSATSSSNNFSTSSATSSVNSSGPSHSLSNYKNSNVSINTSSGTSTSSGIGTNIDPVDSVNPLANLSGTRFTPGVPNTGSGGDSKYNWSMLLTMAVAVIGGITYIKNQIAIH